MKASTQMRLSFIAESILKSLDPNNSSLITELFRVLGGFKANCRSMEISDKEGVKLTTKRMAAVTEGIGPVAAGTRIKLTSRIKDKKIVFVHQEIHCKSDKEAPEVLMNSYEHAAFCVVREGRARITYVVSGTVDEIKELKDKASRANNREEFKIVDSLLVINGELHFDELSEPISHFTIATVMGITEWFKPRRFEPARTSIKNITPDMMPDWLFRAVKSLAGNSKSIDYTWAAVIGTVGTLLAKKVRIMLSDEQDGALAPNVWVCLVGDPGTGKTPVIESVLRHVESFKVDPKSHKEFTGIQTVDSAISANKVAAVRRVVKETAESLQKINRNKIARQIDKQFQVEESDYKNLLGKIAIATDTTSAGLKDILAIDAVSVMIVADELKSLLQLLSSHGESKLRAQLLQAESSNSLMSVWRAYQPSKTSNNATLSILSGIQPDALAPFITNATNGDSSNDGLLNRFLITVKNITPADTSCTQSTTDTKMIRLFLMAIFNQNFVWGQSESTNKKGTTFELSNDASILYRKWNERNKEKIQTEQNKLLQSHFSKYVGLVHRLSLIYQVVLSFESKSVSIKRFNEISKEAMQFAIRSVAYLRTHARAVFSTSDDVLHTEAKFVMARLAAERVNHFTASELAQKNWTYIKRDSDKARRILNYLEGFGLVRHVNEGRKVTWQVNPVAKVLFKT